MYYVSIERKIGVGKKVSMVLPALPRSSATAWSCFVMSIEFASPLCTAYLLASMRMQQEVSLNMLQITGFLFFCEVYIRASLAKTLSRQSFYRLCVTTLGPVFVKNYATSGTDPSYLIPFTDCYDMLLSLPIIQPEERIEIPLVICIVICSGAMHSWLKVISMPFRIAGALVGYACAMIYQFILIPAVLFLVLDVSILSLLESCGLLNASSPDMYVQCVTAQVILGIYLRASSAMHMFYPDQTHAPYIPIYCSLVALFIGVALCSTNSSQLLVASIDNAPVYTMLAVTAPAIFTSVTLLCGFIPYSLLYDDGSYRDEIFKNYVGLKANEFEFYNKFLKRREHPWG